MTHNYSNACGYAWRQSIILRADARSAQTIVKIATSSIQHNPLQPSASQQAHPSPNNVSKSIIPATTKLMTPIITVA